MMIGEDEWVICIGETGAPSSCLIRAMKNGLGYIASKKNRGYVFITNDLIGKPYGSCFDMKLIEDAEARKIWETHSSDACASDKYLQNFVSRGKKRQNDGTECVSQVHSLYRVRGVGVVPPSTESELRETRNDLIQQLKAIDQKLEIASSYNEDTSVQLKTNQYFHDSRDAQMLGKEQVESLVETGIHASDLVGKLVENSRTFELKTEFAKDKYIEKHTKQWSKRFRVVPATAQTIAETLWLPTQFTSFRIGNMRPFDTIPLILSQSNTQPGSRVLIVENMAGLLVGSLMERLGGIGKVYGGHFDEPSIEMVKYFNFDKDHMATFQEVDLTLLCGGLPADNKEQVGDRKREFLKKFQAKLENKIKEDNATDAEKALCQEQFSALGKTLNQLSSPKSEEEKLNLQNRLASFEDLSTNGADALILASKYEPLILFQALYKYLAPSRPFVIYSEEMYELETIRHWLFKEHGCAVGTRLGETWCRSYQVLPGRTHPEMMTSATGGYLLTGIKVIPNRQLSGRQYTKMPKIK